VTGTARRFVVLDRDGVINFDSDAYIKGPDEWRPLPGSLEAIADLNSAGFDVFVVTNQSGLGRGLFSQEALDTIHAKMLEAVKTAGGAIRRILYCPHRPEDGCACRKPAPGLLLELARELDLELRGAPVIGDKWSDLEAARAVGARPILVTTGRGEETLRTHRQAVKESYRDLAAAAVALIGE
jgi:D-glycero-D-manno-heptose 1,7-bisphosphate phosphatase